MRSETQDPKQWDGTLPRAQPPLPGPQRDGLSSSTVNNPFRHVASATGEDDGGSGSAPLVGTGVSAVARIPVPGTDGLFVELRPRGWTPKTGSTSALFIPDVTGKRHLRLDFGYNVKTNKVEYHWNQKGTFGNFQVPNHSPAGTLGEVLYQGARYLRYGGRILLVVGVAIDAYSIVMAKKRWRQIARVAAGWAGAWAGCQVVGAAGAAGGSFIEPGGGTAAGGIAGCIVGGIGGYAGASWAAGRAYDWVEETFFEPLPEASPAEVGR